MNSFIWNLSQVLAHTIQYEKTAEFGGVEAYNFDFGQSDSSSNSKFQRKGRTQNTKSTQIPTFLKDIITSNVTDSKISSTLSGGQDNFLNSLLTQNNASPPGLGFLQNQMQIDPTQYDGKGTLQAIAGRNPFSDDYKADTSARYDDTVKQGLAHVSSGPDSVRGGQNRVALAQGEAIDKMALNRTDEIRRAQVQDAGLASGAAQIMAAIESGRRAIITGAQDQWVKQFLGGESQGIEAVRSLDARRGLNTGNTALAARELGTETSTVDEDLTGRGTQSGSSSQWGVNVLGGCCFIFLEGLNGQLPWYVRRGRDVFQTKERRVGYVRMSQWLVPLMAQRPLVKYLVNTVLIKPFLKVGAWFFGESPVNSPWRFLRPYCNLWFKLWDYLGRKGE